MNTKNWLDSKLAARARTWFGAQSRLPLARTSVSVDEEPLRAHLFTAEEMEQHGRHLAAVHELTRKRSRDHLLRRLGDNECVLADTCALLAHSADQQRRVTPAGEWLLDNFYLIEEEVRTAKRHLPPGYSRELPRLAGGASAGLPRVYDLALHAVAHGDSRLGRGSLTRFIASYQVVKTLRLGELWAVPIMLRLALIENLRRVAAGVAASMTERDLAGHWADRMIDVAWVQQDLARCQALLDAIRLMTWRLVNAVADNTLGPAEASSVKVFGTEQTVEVYRTLQGILAPAAYLRTGSPGSVLHGELERANRASQINTFGGGVNEIQRELVAQAGLGLKRSR